MNQTTFANRAAVVTGGARGIGYAIAERLLRSGAKCALWDRDESALASAVQSLSHHDQCIGIPVDVTRPDSVKTAADKTIAQLNSVHILVNNAGVAGASKKLWEYSTE